MSTVDRRRARGHRLAARTVRLLGQELRDARVAAGLSQDALAMAAGVTGSTVGRIERGEQPAVSVTTATDLFSILGQRLSVQPYPEGPPLRDVGHARLLSRFGRRLPDIVALRTEVPVVSGGDLRAWDGLLVAPDWRCPLEAETALADLQATDRRIARKLEDSDFDRVILLVADTRRNRAVLREFRPLLAGSYPLDGRAIFAALRTGHRPAASGVLIM